MQMIDKLKELLGIELIQQEVEYDIDDYSSVESYSATVPYLETNHGENEFYINIYDGNGFCFWYDASPVPLSIHTEDEARHMIQTLIEVPLPIDKLNKDALQDVFNYINTSNGY